MKPTLQPNEPLMPVERVALIAGLVIAAILMWPLRSHVTDDTFVHLQYARHLAEGKGPVFNPGEHVYACTSPLWAALLADGMAIGWDGLIVARVIGFIATLTTIPLFLQLMRRSLRLPALRAYATVGWAMHAWLLKWSTSGMETALAVALILAGFVAFTEGKQWGSRPVRTGALWSLAALTRPEAVFLLVLYGIVLLIDANNRTQLRRLLLGVLPPVVIYGTWLLFARLFFGTFWPRALAARAVLPFGPDSSSLLLQFKKLAQTEGVLMVVMALALTLGGRAWWARGPFNAQRALPWAWILTLPLLYAARGVPASSRYLVMVSPVLAWLAWRAADGWWLGLEAESKARRTQARVLGFVVLLLWAGTNLTVYRSTIVPEVVGSSASLRHSLVHWGQWFREHAAPSAVIASPEVGAIGFHSDRPVLDLSGQISPQIERVVRGRPAAVPELQFARYARPAYLVDRSTHAYDLLDRSPWAAALTPLGRASAYPREGADTVYTIYRIDWDEYDAMLPALPDSTVHALPDTTGFHTPAE